ncbi:MAG: AAA family ATPase [Gemmatimonadota bacterium]|nr:AAA family ATPase [Gemmatimonadota bacterium]
MSRDYTLSVKDFGPIAEADVELRPMTVFVGPSNTGKSYFATLAYALHRCLGDQKKLWELAEPSAPGPNLSTSTRLDAWARAVAKSKLGSAQPWLPALPREVDDFVRSFLVVAPGVGRAVEEELERCFSVRRVQELIRSPQASGSRIKLEIPRAGKGGALEYLFRVHGESVWAGGDVTGEASFEQDQIDTVYMRALHRLAVRHAETLPPLDGEDGSGAEVLAMLAEHLMRLVCKTVQSWLLHPVAGSMAYYLPSDRAGLAHTRDVVVSSLLRRASATAPERDALLSGVSGDFLDQLVRISAELGDQDPAILRLAHRLEEAVLAGDVRVERPEAGFAHLWYRPAGWDRDLPLMRASSMVVELAPMVLYLRHVVRPGDLLIIDEPESHLHPGLQVEVIRGLADIVHSGVRMIITTHSEWVLEELSNLVLASQLPEDKRRELNGGAQPLSPEEVGVWLFKAGEASQGSVVSEIRLEQSNLYSSSFDEVAANTYNDWANIADLLEGA